MVSPICLGAMMFGLRTDESEARRIIGSARHSGINFIDTADWYAEGESERMLGKLLQGDRDWWVIATKVGFATSNRPNDDGISRRHIRDSVEKSLRALRTDRIDVYYLHRGDDGTTPLEETLQTVAELIRQGKVLYLGLSNLQGWRLAEAVMLCRELAMPTPVVLQPYYNAMNRQPEVDLLPAAEHFGLGVVPYSPLARGVLTGKYRLGEEPPADSRAGRKDARMVQAEWRPESLELVEKIRARAEARGMTTGQWAVNWLLWDSLITSILAGPRTYEQWVEYLGALDHAVDEEDVAFLDSLVPPGYASTYGYTDPQFPLRARSHHAQPSIR
jgi:aryl-alcohol dehydrogenase-like predicted oxidoreductase